MEEKTLQENLDLGNPDNNMGDLYVAKIQDGGMALKKLSKKATIMKNMLRS